MPAFRRFLFAGVAVLATVLWSAGPVGAGGSEWKVGYLTPSGRTLSFASADQTDSGLAAFNFTNQPNTSLLVTTHGSSSVLGDLNGRTITATFDISGSGFFYDTTMNPCGTPANTRLYFQTDNSGGFAFTHFWWSNPNSQILMNGKNLTVTATVEPAQWSDWDGKGGLTDPAAFADAASNVKMIGLSFGGGCFFENGVGTTDGSGTLTLDSFDLS